MVQVIRKGVAVKQNWEGFLTPFYTPAGAGNGSLHDVIETKVQMCWIKAAAIQDQVNKELALHAAMSLQRHWSNCLVGLTNDSIRNSQGWLSQSWSVLQLYFNAVVELLPAEQQESCSLSAEEITAIEALFRQFNLL